MSKNIFNSNRNIVLIHNKSNNIFEDKSESISRVDEAYYYNNHTGYNVYFNNRNQFYFYPKNRFYLLTKLREVKIEDKSVEVNGNIMFNVTKIEVFSHKYYRVHIMGATITTNRVKIVTNINDDIGRYFAYYKGISTLQYKLIDENSPESYLYSVYQQILQISQKSIYYKVYSDNILRISDKKTVIYPFNFNKSQQKAIETALTNEISIIEGPPGTGKTQTILNIISNLIIRDKTVLVVSNNNTAIENIYEKFDEMGLSFLIAKLGNKENKEEFLNKDSIYNIGKFLDENKNFYYDHNEKDYSTNLLRIKQTYVDQYRLPKLKLDLLETEKEYSHFRLSFPFEYNPLDEKVPYRQLLKIKLYIENNEKIGWFKRWRLSRILKIRFKNENILEIVNYIEDLYYKNKISSIKKEISIVENNLLKNKLEDLKTYNQKHSNSIYKKYLLDKYKNVDLKSYDDSYTKVFNSFVKQHPIILSTTHASLKSIGEGYLFDYVIFDEATQSDLLSSVIALSIAKNAVIVGDSKQLPEITNQNLYEYAEQLEAKYSIDKKYSYIDNSVLSMVKNSVIDIQVTLLNEHYRSEPRIANFFNQKFYDGELIIMTKKQDESPFEIIKTVQGNHARKNPNGSGWYNQRELDEINEYIETNGNKDIGIITPFNLQARMFQELFINNEEIESDTVHKFQGRQKDHVILSTVVNNLEVNENIDNLLYDFINNPKLTNVAISRAKSKLTLVVSDGVYNSQDNNIVDLIKYIKYHSDSVDIKEGKITSIFDKLYQDQDKEFIATEFHKPMYKSEYLTYKLIKDILKEYSQYKVSLHVRLSNIIYNYDGFDEEEIKYLKHPWCHVDFMIYDNLTKEPKLIIEVDGIQYHEKNEKQLKKDKIKDKALKNNNINFIRLKTNESNERERIIQNLNLK